MDGYTGGSICRLPFPPVAWQETAAELCCTTGKRFKWKQRVACRSAGKPFRKAGGGKQIKNFWQGINNPLDYGGEYVTSAIKIVERAIVAPKGRVIKDTMRRKAVAGPPGSPSQIMPKGLDLYQEKSASDRRTMGVALFW